MTCSFISDDLCIIKLNNFEGEIFMGEINKVKTRDEIEQQYKWNVEKIYINNNDWEKDFNELKEYGTTDIKLC